MEHDHPLPNTVLHAVLEVLALCGPQAPADAVLAQRLRARKSLAGTRARDVARAVHAYFRWAGWLRAEDPAEAVAQALALEQRFARNPEAFTEEELAGRALPDWVGAAVRGPLGPWSRALQTPPRVWLRARPGRAASVAAALRSCSVPLDVLPEALVYGGEADLFRTDGFRAGDFELQDVSSQLVALACAPRAGETWWDACAGEGGKTMHLADLMENRGMLWASDKARWRLDRLRRRAGRARVFNYRVALWNGSPTLPIGAKCHGVLLDAPCSGLGTWHRDPHARWMTTAADVAELGALQEALLRHAAAAVRPGGRLVYAVCTLTHDETDAVADAFERNVPGFEPAPLGLPALPGHPDAGEAVRLQVWPQDFGGNGMYLAAWRRLPLSA